MSKWHLIQRTTKRSVQKTIRIGFSTLRLVSSLICTWALADVFEQWERKRRLVSADVRGAETRDELLRTFAWEVTSPFVACDVSLGETSVPQPQKSARLMTSNLSGIWPGAPIGRICSYICFNYDLRTTDKRQKQTKVKCKRNEPITKQSIFVKLVFFF